MSKNNLGFLLSLRHPQTNERTMEQTELAMNVTDKVNSYLGNAQEKKESSSNVMSKSDIEAFEIKSDDSCNPKQIAKDIAAFKLNSIKVTEWVKSNCTVETNKEFEQAFKSHQALLNRLLDHRQNAWKIIDMIDEAIKM